MRKNVAFPGCDQVVVPSDGAKSKCDGMPWGGASPHGLPEWWCQGPNVTAFHGVGPTPWNAGAKWWRQVVVPSGGAKSKCDGMPWGGASPHGLPEWWCQGPNVTAFHGVGPTPWNAGAKWWRQVVAPSGGAKWRCQAEVKWWRQVVAPSGGAKWWRQVEVPRGGAKWRQWSCGQRRD